MDEHDVMKIREGVAFHPAPTENGKIEFILSTPDGRHFKVSQLAKTILELFDGQRNLEGVTKALAGIGVPLSVDQVRDLVSQRFGKMGVFEGESSEKQQRTDLLILHCQLISAKLVGAIARKMVFLYRPLWVALAFGLIVSAHWFSYGLKAEVMLPTTEGRISPQAYLAVFLLMIASVLCHEFGHATALARKKTEPGGIGFGLFVLMPTFYADVSAVWRLQSRDRVVVDLGGVYFQLICSAIYCYLGILLEVPELVVACHVIDAIILLNLNPFFQFDGYWCLVDYLNLPKLQSMALTYIKSKIQSLLGKGNVINPPELNRFKLAVFRGYAIISVLLIGIFTYISYVYLNQVAVSYPKAIPLAFQQMAADLERGMWLAAFADGVLLGFLLTIPTTCLVGVIIMGLRFFRAIAVFIKKGFVGASHEHRADPRTIG